LRLAALGAGAELLRLDDLERGSPHLCFRVEEGRPLLVGSEGEAELVVAGRFGELAEEVLRRLGEGGFVALEGPRGVGKSALALYCAWLALRRGLAPALLRAERLAAGSTLISKIAGEAGGKLLVLYDPSPLRAGYEPVVAGGEGGGDLERALRVLLRLAGEGRVAAIAVLPEGWAGLLSPELRERLGRFTLRADLGDPRFLEGVVKAYSGCAGDLRGLAEMLKGLEEGCTLAAKYAGLWLREKGCRLEAVEEALRGAAGSAKLFLASYIWSVVLRGNEGELARRVAPPLLIRALSGPIPEGVTHLTRSVLSGGSWRIFEPAAEGVKLEDLREADLEPVARWFAARREDLVEEALRELCGVERGSRPAPGHPPQGVRAALRAAVVGCGRAAPRRGGLAGPGRAPRLRRQEARAGPRGRRTRLLAQAGDDRGRRLRGIPPGPARGSLAAQRGAGALRGGPLPAGGGGRRPTADPAHGGEQDVARPGRADVPPRPLAQGSRRGGQAAGEDLARGGRLGPQRAPLRSGPRAGGG
jgi:hypothetical protein